MLPIDRYYFLYYFYSRYHLKSRKMKTLERIANKIATFRKELQTTTDPDRKAELEEDIDALEDKLEELEDAEQEQQDYEEATGTNPQDLYNERNSYAISQSERYEQFRNEY